MSQRPTVAPAGRRASASRRAPIHLTRKTAAALPLFNEIQLTTVTAAAFCFKLAWSVVRAGEQQPVALKQVAGSRQLYGVLHQYFTSLYFTTIEFTQGFIFRQTEVIFV